MNTHHLKITIYLALAFILSACCPKNGVDRSYTVNEYAVAVDYFSLGQPVEVKLVPKSDTTVELFDKDSVSEKPIYSNYDSSQSNRIIYYFNSVWSTEKIKSLNIKFSNVELNNLDFNTVDKASFQRPSSPFNQQFTKVTTIKDQFECAINSISQLFISRANAFSCKTSDDSMVYYRTGTLVRINLN
ncbi:MAG: hypothetical protein ABL930_09220 [Pseudobdellovibrio sp.]